MKKGGKVIKFYLYLFVILCISYLSYNFFFKRTDRELIIRTNFFTRSPGDTLDPAKVYFTREYLIVKNLTANLIQIGANDEYENDLAESFQFSEDQLTIDIQLKKEARFSDGSPITSQDVAKSLKRAILLGTPHVNTRAFFSGAEKLTSIDDQIEGIRVLSDKRLQIKLTQPTKEILFFLTLADLSILHKTQYEKNHLRVSDWEGITAGAYRVSYTKEGDLMLVANRFSHNFKPEMPQKITLEGDRRKLPIPITRQLRDKTLDLGRIDPHEYFDQMNQIESVKGFDIIAGENAFIVYITLNPLSHRFRQLEDRQWIQKKIIENYKINPRYSSTLTKALQFFPPKARGHLSKEKVLNILKHVDTSKVPPSLKGGLTIRALKTMKHHLPGDIASSLSKSLGIPVRIQEDLLEEDYLRPLTERTFEADIISVSTAYKPLGELIHRHYISSRTIFTDPTHRIQKLLHEYKNKENVEEESRLISQILEQMIHDSECIPLHYQTYLFFINKDLIDIPQNRTYNFSTFHKMVVLQ